MSHTTTIAKVLITDPVAFKAAVAELKRRGVLKGELVENAIPRAYSSNQTGMSAPADLCLRLDGSPYDVGFYQTGKGLEARTDFWGGHVQKQLGATPGPNDDRDQAKMGKLYQEYAAQVTMKQAVQQGRTVRRVDQKDGSVQIVVGIN